MKHLPRIIFHLSLAVFISCLILILFFDADFSDNVFWGLLIVNFLSRIIVNKLEPRYSTLTGSLIKKKILYYGIIYIVIICLVLVVFIRIRPINPIFSDFCLGCNLAS